MRNRFYSPSIGRFISEDPIGLAGGDLLFYRYVGNDPVNMIDPEGLSGLIMFARPTPIIRPSVARTIPRITRGIPRQKPNVPQPKWSPEPVNEPLPDLMPEPGPLAEFMRLLADLLGGDGSGPQPFGFFPPKIDNNNSDDPCNKVY